MPVREPSGLAYVVSAGDRSQWTCSRDVTPRLLANRSAGITSEPCRCHLSARCGLQHCAVPARKPWTKTRACWSPRCRYYSSHSNVEGNGASHPRMYVCVLSPPTDNELSSKATFPPRECFRSCFRGHVRPSLRCGFMSTALLWAVTVWHVDTAAAVAREDTLLAFSGSVSPDSKTFSISSESAQMLWIFDFGSTRCRQLHLHPGGAWMPAFRQSKLCCRSFGGA